MDKPLPAPTNRLVELANLVLDILFKGIGVDAAIAAGLAAEPWLGVWGISWVFKGVVKLIAGSLDDVIAKNLDNLIIRKQGGALKKEHDDAIDEFKKETGPGVSKEDHAKALAKARAAIDAIINKSR